MEYKDGLIKLKEIVNRHINAFTVQDASIITDEQTFLIPSSTQHLHFSGENSVFDKIFNLNAASQKGVKKSFFHYKSFDIAYKFVDEEFISASALSNFTDSNDDLKEYEHFFATTKIPYDSSYIESQKNGVFVFCLTEDSVTERFWKEYVSDHKGLCLEFDFQSHEHLKEAFELRKICYDDGSDFKFYSDMQDEIYSIFDRYLLAPGLAKFGALYKRKILYSWERETRLLVNWNFYQGDLINNSFSIFKVGTKSYLKIPLINNLFTLTIKSIKIGKHLSNLQKEKIKILADSKGIPCQEE